MASATSGRKGAAMSSEEAEVAPEPRPHRRRWSRRRSWMGIRNGRLAVLALCALVVGVGITILTAYLGIR